MSRLNARNPGANQANPEPAMLQKYMPLIFGLIYLNIAAIINVYFIFSSGIRIGTQEVLFRKGIVAGPPPASSSGPKGIPAKGPSGRGGSGPKSDRTEREMSRAKPASSSKPSAGTTKRNGTGRDGPSGSSEADPGQCPGQRGEWPGEVDRRRERVCLECCPQAKRIPRHRVEQFGINPEPEAGVCPSKYQEQPQPNGEQHRRRKGSPRRNILGRRRSATKGSMSGGVGGSKWEVPRRGRESALDLLGVAEDDAEFVVLSEPKAGLFGRLRGEARVQARVRPMTPPPKRGRRQRPDRKRSGGEGASSSPGERFCPGGTDSGDDGRQGAQSLPLGWSGQEPQRFSPREVRDQQWDGSEPPEPGRLLQPKRFVIRQRRASREATIRATVRRRRRASWRNH